MKKAEKREARVAGRVLGRVLAEELGAVRGGQSAPVLSGATGTATVQENGNKDFTGGRPGQSDGD